MLEQIDDNLWVAGQPLKFLGLNVGTRMTVVRLSHRELVVISPIEIDRATTEQLNALGDVKSIVAPNFFHHLFLSHFKNLYPQAKLYAPSGLKEKIPDLAIDFLLDNRSDYFGNELEYRRFEGVNTFLPSGVASLNEYVFYHRSSQTLIVTDTAFFVDESFSPVLQLVARVFGGYKQLRPSFLEKWGTSEKERVRRSAQILLGWDFKRAIVAHGSIVEEDAKRQFREGYEWLLGQSLG